MEADLPYTEPVTVRCGDGVVESTFIVPKECLPLTDERRCELLREHMPGVLGPGTLIVTAPRRYYWKKTVYRVTKSTWSRR